MKKLLLFTFTLTLASIALADISARPANDKFIEDVEAVHEDHPEGLPIFAFAAYGVQSGYQVLGSVVSRDPVIQGYSEINCFLPYNLGFFGFGLITNTDLGHHHHQIMSRWFNEWDPNVHWDKTFFFDDDHLYGLNYRSTINWYIYPTGRIDHKHRNGTCPPYIPSIPTSMEWIHYFGFQNPYVTPFVEWRHEYLVYDADLWKFGLKKEVQVSDTVKITPYVETVLRSKEYVWCFPTEHSAKGPVHGSWGSLTLGLNCHWQLTEHFGLFANVAYCRLMSEHLRDMADRVTHEINKYEIGTMKDAAWGGVGITVNF